MAARGSIFAAQSITKDSERKLINERSHLNGRFNAILQAYFYNDGLMVSVARTVRVKANRFQIVPLRAWNLPSRENTAALKTESF